MGLGERPQRAVGARARALLIVASILLLRDHLSGGSTGAEIPDFHLRTSAGSVALASVYLAPFSGIAFLWFIAAIRNLMAGREDPASSHGGSS